MVVVQRGAGEEGTVWVEGCTRDRGGAVMVEEARVGLEGGEVGPVDVVSFDLVAVCAAAEFD